MQEESIGYFQFSCLYYTELLNTNRDVESGSFRVECIRGAQSILQPRSRSKSG